MALKNTADGQSLQTADVFSLNTTPLSFCCWANLISNKDYATLFGATQNSSHYFVVYIRSGSGESYYPCIFEDWGSGSSRLDRGTAALTAGQWYFIAATRAAGVSQARAMYVCPWGGTWGASTGTGPGGTIGTLTDFTIFDNTAFSGENSNSLQAHAKVWNAVLSEAELMREMRSFRPARTANLVYWNPLQSNGTQLHNYAAGGWKMTATGTLSLDKDPQLDLIDVPKGYTRRGSSLILLPNMSGAEFHLAPAAAETGATVAPGVGALTITGAAPTIFRTQSAAPGVAALSITGLAPTVAVTQTAAPGAGALTVTGLAPTVAVTNNLITQPGAGALTVTGAAPTANVTQSAAPGVGALTITGHAPTASVTQSVAPGAGALTVTGLAPTVRVSLSAAPGVGALTITGAAPVANVTQSAAPGAGAIVLTGHAPSAVVSAAGTVNPGAAALDITGHAPTANVSQSVAPGYADILLTGFAPTISIASADKIVAPGLAALFLVGYAPEAIVSGQKRAEAGSSKRRRRIPVIRLPEDIERERQEREDQEAQPAQAQAKPEPKRAKRTGKGSRGIRLAPDLEAQRAAEILAQRTAELMAQQQGERRALLAEELAMLEAAAAIEAENEMIMLLLMAA